MMERLRNWRDGWIHTETSLVTDAHLHVAPGQLTQLHVTAVSNIDRLDSILSFDEFLGTLLFVKYFL